MEGLRFTAVWFRLKKLAINPGSQYLQDAAIVIHATEPEPALADFVVRLTDAGFTKIVVVDNAGGPAFRELFDRIALISGVVIVGRALRGTSQAALATGLNHALYAFPDITGVLAVDASRQPEIEVLRRAAEALADRRHFPQNGVEPLTRDAAALRLKPWRDIHPIDYWKAAPPFRWPVPWIWLMWLLLLIPVAIEIKAFRTAGLMSLKTWDPVGALRFARYTLVFALLTTGFWFLARRWFLPVLAASTILLSAWAVGAVPVASVLLFVFSLTVLGRLLFSEKVAGEKVEGPLAFLAGMAIWIAAMYATAHLVIHYPITYLAALMLPGFIGRRQAATLGKQWRDTFRPAPPLSPGGFLAAAFAAFALLASWLITLKPEVGTDSLAMHLAVPARFAQQHAFTFDFREFIWALMPMGGDFCYTVVYMLGGEYAARLLNFALLVVASLILFRAARTFVSAPMAGLLTALFLSTPMVYLATGSLFVENFVAAMLLGAVVALWRFRENPSTRGLALAAVLFGTSMAMKTGAIPAGIIGLVLILLQVRKLPAGSKIRWAAAAVVLVLGLGSIPYAKAWAQSGNPVFPFENQRFHSPYIHGGDIRDARYHEPPNWRTPVNLTFRTNLYFEGQNGSLGFQYLLFLPLTLGALLFAMKSARHSAKTFAIASAVGIGLVSDLIVVLAQPNARYLYFTFPLLTLGAAAAFGWLRTRQTTRTQQTAVFRAATAAALFAAFFNIYFLPTSDWYHRDFYSSPIFSAAGRAKYLHENAPVREVVEWLNRQGDMKPVMFADGPEIARLQSPVYENHWHDYPFLTLVRESPRALDVLAVLKTRRISHLVVDRSNQDRQAALSDLITRCGVEEFSAASISSITLRPDCEAIVGYQPPTWGECKPGDPLPSGIHDDRYPLIRYLGPWTMEDKFPSTFRRTISYSNAPEARVCISFEGKGFDYVYTKDLNRGKAEVIIDGRKTAVIDLYGRNVRWRSKSRIGGLTPGRHELTLRVMPEKNPASSDFFVDLDAITIF